MITRADIVIEAKTWIGTPFHHQAAVKRVGCDCAGMVKGVWRELGNDVSKVPVDYPRTPSGGNLVRILIEFLDRTVTPKAGDVILFTLLNEPQHLGILTDKNTVIHAYQPFGKVVEHRLDDKWKRRVTAYYSFRGVE
ncbi:NlpC/P60 family protein [Sedimenticola selenatireducens]|uniref:Peptidase P60 n=1 Tax=Sedimenticola selenatireducens TaxID=191960 RepID=A0A558E1E4_9GAMM|nr:NlpC/P60 family protein [Sedimenticola selenatireducens]TVO75145.1 peptidase P60 [Sedimenticola selenatireducens]TVT67000.1 MAG: peptidase P60 [Sedimenticola selenatireducens]